jgi:hypothetical protein
LSVIGSVMALAPVLALILAVSYRPPLAGA